MSKEFVDSVSLAIKETSYNEDLMLKVYSMEILSCTTDPSMKIARDPALCLGSNESDFQSFTSDEEEHYATLSQLLLVSKWFFIGTQCPDQQSISQYDQSDLAAPGSFFGSIVSDDGMYAWQYDASKQNVTLVPAAQLAESNSCDFPSLFHIVPHLNDANLYTISPSSLDGSDVIDTSLHGYHSKYIQWNTKPELNSALKVERVKSYFTISGLPFN